MQIPALRFARGPRSVCALAVAVGLSLALGVPSATAQPTGAVQIKGKRYVDGEETKVKCSKTEGHVLDATTSGTRVMTLANTPDCIIFTDTPGDSGVFTFSGLEDELSKNGTVKPRYVFGGVESGGLVDGGAESLLSGKSGTARATFLKDKGTLTYSYVNEFTQEVIFVGKYLAKFP